MVREPWQSSAIARRIGNTDRQDHQRHERRSFEHRCVEASSVVAEHWTTSETGASNAENQVPRLQPGLFSSGSDAPFVIGKDVARIGNMWHEPIQRQMKIGVGTHHGQQWRGGGLVVVRARQMLKHSGARRFGFRDEQPQWLHVHR